jgi:anti-sigma regulatory factor (Ser/Thr protein kinase)
MSLAKTKRSRLIRRFLLNSVKAGNQRLIHDAVETFEVSRQTIHSHLSALVKMGYLIAEGNTRGRTYQIGPHRSLTLHFSLEGLQESDVYHRNFGFVFEGLPHEVEEICEYGFTEILNNAIDHSDGTSAHIDVDRTNESIVIRISDDGEGIFNRIARILELGDPRESLLELSKGKLTTDPDNHTGQGIFFSSRAFDIFYIFSGDLAFMHDDGDDKDYLMHDDGDQNGTFVVMRIALNSNKRLGAVFDDFTGSEDEDFAFNTTVVPVQLALYEGERLVSRSQAKRILNRVDKFKTVLLDFKKVDFIGQAFADEVFRVFSRRNPQITIVPINVIDKVERMIIAAQGNKD